MCGSCIWRERLRSIGSYVTFTDGESGFDEFGVVLGKDLGVESLFVFLLRCGEVDEHRELDCVEQQKKDGYEN